MASSIDAGGLPAALVGRLTELSTLPVLLVATDYDGTVAPIVDDPMAAKPHREAIVALEALARMPQTHAAVISGRALRDLAALSRLTAGVHLVGSHGSEFDLDFANRLTADEQARLTESRRGLEALAQRFPGSTVEKKPASTAFHFRLVPDAEDRAAAEREAIEGPGELEGVHVKRGKMVVELAVQETHKGTALDVIRHRVGASAVIFLGDDVTDEDAFATLRGPDVSVKVGSGETDASYRVSGPYDVARALALIAEERAAWLAGSQAVPIEEHSMLTDMRSMALVDSSATLSWMAAPRIDSAPLVAGLLGGPADGRFSVRAVGEDTAVEQSWRGDSLVLESRMGSVVISDFFDVSGDRPRQRAGRSDFVRILEGEGQVSIAYAPRPDFGRKTTRFRVEPDGLLIEGSVDPIALYSPGVSWTLEEEGSHQVALATIEVRPDAPVALELRWGSGSLRPATKSVFERRDRTAAFWSDWASTLDLPATRQSLLRRSALYLRGLVFGPTGAIAAAATTSLPEYIGGVRNWDYRYCWLRDGALTAAALVRVGSTSEAMAFLDWVQGVLEATQSAERLKPLYDVSGRDLGPEATIEAIAGYRGSRPVRVGNAAAGQVQLDVFGPLADLLALLAEHDAPLTPEHARFAEQMVDAVARRWQEPDHGIWEIRKPRRHHVHSKVMCWVTVDRAIRLLNHLDRPVPPEWAPLREAIADDVCTHGYKPSVGAFTAAYDGEDLDAATLLIGTMGLIQADDPRFVGTVEAIERELRDGPTVYRYRADDGLPGSEGGFHYCASWLVDAYALMGRPAQARALFDAICDLAGPTGTLSEQYDPQTQTALGNVPQAYSHLGILDNALRLESPSDPKS